MTKIVKRNRWEIWRDVIIALFVREIKTGFNDKFGVSWSVVSPLAFIFIISFVRGRMSGADVYGIPMFTFMSVGFLIFYVYNDADSAATSSIKKARALFAFRQVLPISAVIASGIFALVSKFITLTLLVLIMYFLNMEIRIDNLLVVILIVANVWLWALALGLIVGIASTFVPEISKVWGLATRPLLFISCVFYSINEVPQEYWKYFYWNPLAQAIELTRNAMYSNYPPGPMEGSFLIIFCIVLLFASLAIYQATWKRTLVGG